MIHLHIIRYSCSFLILDDRYAALADLDLALRQQNMKHMGKEEYLLYNLIDLFVNCSLSRACYAFFLFKLTFHFQRKTTV